MQDIKRIDDCYYELLMYIIYNNLFNYLRYNCKLKHCKRGFEIEFLTKSINDIEAFLKNDDSMSKISELNLDYLFSEIKIIAKKIDYDETVALGIIYDYTKKIKTCRYDSRFEDYIYEENLKRFIANQLMHGRSDWWYVLLDD